MCGTRFNVLAVGIHTSENSIRKRVVAFILILATARISFVWRNVTQFECEPWKLKLWFVSLFLIVIFLPKHPQQHLNGLNAKPMAQVA